MTAAPATSPDISPEFVAGLAERAQEAEQLRRLPGATVDDFIASGLPELLVPARYGGLQAPWSAILDPVRRMAHGCASSAWTLGFYTLHNWMMALFGEEAQEEAFATRPFLAPAPLAPTGRGVPVDGGIRLSGRWSWATGVMHGNWIIVGALCGPDDRIYPALALLPISEAAVEDVWHTDGMCATGSNDVVVADAFVPAHRLVRVTDIYKGTAPGAALHDADTYRWPMVPALALLAAMPALGSAERGSTSTPSACRNACSPTRASRRRTNRSRRLTSARRGCACGRCAGCSPKPSASSKSWSRQAIPCRAQCAVRRGWRQPTS